MPNQKREKDPTRSLFQQIVYNLQIILKRKRKNEMTENNSVEIDGNAIPLDELINVYKEDG